MQKMASDMWAADYQDKLNNSSEKCAGCDCVLWKGSTEKGKRVNYGQICAKVKMTSTGSYEYHTMKVHRLQYMVMIKDSAQLKEEGMHVSHLCFSHLCIKPQHLSYEPGNVNNSREACKSESHCYGHDSYKDCIFCNC